MGVRDLKWGGGSALWELRKPKAQAWMTPGKPTCGGLKNKTKQCDYVNRGVKSFIWEGFFLLNSKVRFWNQCSA